MTPDPIIPAADLALLLEAAHLREAAGSALAAAREEALRLRATARAEGRAEGLAEGAAAAARLLAETRAETLREAEALEDMLARLVAETVRGILGEGDRDATARAAVRTALLRLGARETARLHVSADMAGPVRAALADIAADLPLVVDEALPAGSALLSGPESHVHLGPAAQLDARLAPFEGRP